MAKTDTSSDTPTAPTMNVGRWSEEEHNQFLQGLKLYGRDWKSVQTLIPTRTVVQIRTHAQKYFQKLTREHGLLHAEREFSGGAAIDLDRQKALDLLHVRPHAYSGIGYAGVSLSTLGKNDNDPNGTGLGYISVSSGGYYARRYREVVPTRSSTRVAERRERAANSRSSTDTSSADESSEYANAMYGYGAYGNAYGEVVDSAPVAPRKRGRPRSRRPVRDRYDDDDEDYEGSSGLQSGGVNTSQTGARVWSVDVRGKPPGRKAYSGNTTPLATAPGSMQSYNNAPQRHHYVTAPYHARSMHPQQYLHPVDTSVGAPQPGTAHPSLPRVYTGSHPYPPYAHPVSPLVQDGMGHAQSGGTRYYAVRPTGNSPGTSPVVVPPGTMSYSHYTPGTAYLPVQATGAQPYSPPATYVCESCKVQYPFNGYSLCPNCLARSPVSHIHTPGIPPGYAVMDPYAMKPGAPYGHFIPMSPPATAVYYVPHHPPTSASGSATTTSPRVGTHPAHMTYAQAHVHSPLAAAPATTTTTTTSHAPGAAPVTVSTGASVNTNTSGSSKSPLSVSTTPTVPTIAALATMANAYNTGSPTQSPTAQQHPAASATSAISAPGTTTSATSTPTVAATTHVTNTGGSNATAQQNPHREAGSAPLQATTAPPAATTTTTTTTTNPNTIAHHVLTHTAPTGTAPGVAGARTAFHPGYYIPGVVPGAVPGVDSLTYPLAGPRPALSDTFQGASFTTNGSAQRAQLRVDTNVTNTPTVSGDAGRIPSAEVPTKDGTPGTSEKDMNKTSHVDSDTSGSGNKLDMTASMAQVSTPTVVTGSGQTTGTMGINNTNGNDRGSSSLNFLSARGSDPVVSASPQMHHQQQENGNNNSGQQDVTTTATTNDNTDKSEETGDDPIGVTISPPIVNNEKNTGDREPSNHDVPAGTITGGANATENTDGTKQEHKDNLPQESKTEKKSENTMAPGTAPFVMTQQQQQHMYQPPMAFAQQPIYVTPVVDAHGKAQVLMPTQGMAPPVPVQYQQEQQEQPHVYAVAPNTTYVPVTGVVPGTVPGAAMSMPHNNNNLPIAVAATTTTMVAMDHNKPDEAATAAQPETHVRSV